MSDVLAAVLRQPIDWTALPSDTPASVRRLLRRCLEKDRSARLGDMGTARLEIDEARAGDDVAAMEPRAAQLRWRWMSASLALLSVVLAATLTGWPAREVAVNDSVLRFTLVDDPAMQIRFTTQPFAASPDGKTIVFSAAAGSNGLWARSTTRRPGSCPGPRAACSRPSLPMVSGSRSSCRTTSCGRFG